MKVLKRLVLTYLRPQVTTYLDSLLTVYCPDIGVENAIICMLHGAQSHLYKAGNNVRNMFFDFNTLNTIQPIILSEMLQKMQ